MRRNNKDILIGYINTLTDHQAKEAYYILNTSAHSDIDMVRPYKNILLTYGQYNKLQHLWGKDKLDKCFEILDKWIEKKGVDNVNKFSHYNNLIGWVEDKYYKDYNIPKKDQTLKFNSKIDTTWKAKEYVKKIPKDLRAYDFEVKFLVERFGTSILMED